VLRKLRRYNCQELGHFAWECPANKKGNNHEEEQKALLS
jgi:hypothetical protein